MIITRMYSCPPAAQSTLRKSIVMMSIGDVEVTVPNGASEVMCCFFEGKKTCLASKLLTLLGGKIFLLQDVLCFYEILSK